MNVRQILAIAAIILAVASLFLSGPLLVVAVVCVAAALLV